MAGMMASGGGWRGNRWRIAGWGLGAAILTLPLILRAPWDGFDFLVAGIMIGAVGLAFELTVWATRDYAYRGAVGLALAATFLTIWATGAVGMIGDEDNAFNLLFLGVVALALLGALASRFRPGGMAVTMAIAALAQFTISVIGAFQDLRGGIFSAMFAGIWLLSAALFTKSGRDRSGAPAGNG